MKRLWIGLACLVAGPALVACGSDDDDKGDVSPFVGQWNITQGAVNMNCSQLGQQMAGVSGGVNITAGTASDIVVTFSDPAIANCALQMNVKGKVATPLSGQSCTFMLQGASGTFVVNGGTLSVSDTNAASMNLTGNATASLGFAMLMCQGALTGSLGRGTTVDAGGDASSGN